MKLSAEAGIFCDLRWCGADIGASREAAKECSPGRKPWVGREN
jgi:hypothetical protein